MEFKKYQRTNIVEMAERKSFGFPTSDEELNYLLRINISISKADIDNGSPKSGDMIARNPSNHNDMWLVAKDYFKENFEEV